MAETDVRLKAPAARKDVEQRAKRGLGSASGWLLAVLGFAPTLIGLGVSLENQTLINWGTNVATANGIIVVSILNALVSLVLLVSGFRNYVRFQYVMWYAILASFGVMLLLFFTTNPTDAQEQNVSGM